METKQMSTLIGAISVRINKVEGSIPIVFLHGVYYDHNLWNYQTERITKRTVITIDMPFHGMSKKISKRNWTIDDCAFMLLEILDTLKIDKVIAIGHSWGSMTILRAAVKAPEIFQSIGLCNMPFQAATARIKLLFKMQHLLQRSNQNRKNPGSGLFCQPLGTIKMNTRLNLFRFKASKQVYKT